MISKMKITILCIITIIFLMGCAQRQFKDVESPYYRLSVESTVKLQQPLEVPAGRTRIFLQYGRAVDKTQLDHYYPNCNFEVRQLVYSPRQIDSGEFLVTSVRWGRERVVMWDGIQFAGLDMIADGRSNGDDGLYVYRFYHFQLESSSQPDVMRLTCRGGYDRSYRAKLPTLKDIRNALGDVVSINLAE